MPKINFSSSNIENTQNRIVNITGSSTDSQYPSARAVKSYIDNLLADIDYITGTSTVNGWTVDTYKSGKKVAYASETISSADISKTWGSIYVNQGGNYTKSFPSGVFTNVLYKNVYSDSSASYSTWLITQSGGGSSFAYQLARGTSATVPNVKIYFLMIGY